MFVAGIDIGSRGSKAVIMEDSKMVSFSIRETGPESTKTARFTIDQALKGTGLSLEDMGYVVATGYGRILVPFAKGNVSEISCHARGAHWYFPCGKDHPGHGRTGLQGHQLRRKRPGDQLHHE